jgi:hypothetical protein
MSERRVGFVVGGDVVTVIAAEMPEDPENAVIIVADDTWKLQKGDRASAYAVLHQRCHDFLRENCVNSVIVKASALPQSAAKLSLLHSAEVRGVVIAAAASVCDVHLVSKAVISRTYGKRSVDEYLQDDGFWQEQTIGGKLRKTSREAAMLLIASRKT